MKVALYARVSTDKCESCGKKPAAHAKGGHHFRGQDPEVQLRDLRPWCDSRKHKIVAQYVDRGVSGTKASRPELDHLMHDATRGLKNIEAVVVWRLDRFGRSVQHLHNTVATLQAANVQFVSVNEGFDLTTPMGKLFFGILAAFAEFERNVIAERTRAGMRNARAEGRLPGRKIDPERGPSRMTQWRRRQLAKSA